MGTSLQLPVRVHELFILVYIYNENLKVYISVYQVLFYSLFHVDEKSVSLLVTVLVLEKLP